ncbi:MAG: sulfurtransferase [Flavobacteriales bacterium]|jgi:3-mercaptopyruvate sulfurtransferase SseA
MQSTPPVISVEELVALKSTGRCIICDARNNAHAAEQYAQEHIDGALFIDVNKHLAKIPDSPQLGGRHPLPRIEDFADTLSYLGITAEHHVVIYDDAHGANAAARFWWMLKAVGHDKVYVLNGGIQQAKRMGFPLNANTVVNAKSPTLYPVTQWLLPTVSMDEVEAMSGNAKSRILDVRSRERFEGITEPIDRIAGHIPGALNLPFTENLDNQGLIRDPRELRKTYEDFFHDIRPENRIVHCGSGVTACHTILAMAYAGLSLPKLYVGSWSEWSNNHKPMITRDDETNRA